MKNKIKIFITAILVSTLFPTVFAATLRVCPSENVLETQFINHWQQTTDHRFTSIIQMMVYKYHFSGALHAISSTKPTDLNPHLTYIRVIFEPVDPQRGTSRIDCQYKIGNIAMADMNDGYLHLTTEYME